MKNLNNHQERQRHRKFVEEAQPKTIMMTTFNGETEVSHKVLNLNSYEDRTIVMNTLVWAYHNGIVVEFGTQEALDK